LIIASSTNVLFIQLQLPSQRNPVTHRRHLVRFPSL